MAYSMSVSLVGPSDGSYDQSLGTQLELSYTGSALPWEFWVDGELKVAYPQGGVWRSSVSPMLLGMIGNEWQSDTTYSWYVRYASYAATRTFVDDHWEFSGLVYDTTETRTFETVDITFGDTSIEPENGSTIISVPGVLRLSISGPIYWPDNLDKVSSYFEVNGVPYAVDPDLINSWITEGKRVGKSSSADLNVWPAALRLATAEAGLYTWKFFVVYNGELYSSGSYTFTLDVEKAHDPTPEHEATEVDFSDFTLSWLGNAPFDVYMGPVSGSLSLVSSSQTETSYTTNGEELIDLFGEWPTKQRIYWRVDAGGIPGDEWYFDTIAKINQVRLGSGGSFILCMTTRGLYLSTNFGVDWSQNLPDGNDETAWSLGVCSGDGTYLIVKRSSDNALYRSANGGGVWEAITPAGGDTFSANAMAMSEDGQFVVITGANSTTALNSCYISTDYGATWGVVLPTPIPTTWTMCDISDDGEIIGVGRTGSFFATFDGGDSWKEQFPPSTKDWWEHVRVSGDGKVGMVANTGSANETFKTSGWSNQITVSQTALTAFARSLISATNSVEAATALELGIGDSPEFTGMTLSGLTASRLMATDGSKALESVSDLTGWIEGTTNQINSTDEGDGTITLSLPQDIHEGATPTFDGLISTGDIELKAGQKLYFDGD